MFPSNQMNLCKRVVHGATGLAQELHGASHVQRPAKDLLGAQQVSHAHADLPERGQRDAETVGRAGFGLKRHAPLGERQRLVVPVLHERHVRLIPADDGDDVVCAGQDGEALGMAQRRHRLVEASVLGKRDTRERVRQREVAAIARGVQRRGGLVEVFADDCRVGHAAIAERQFEVSEADRLRVVSTLGVLERLAQKRDRARGLAACGGDPALEPPKRRQAGGLHALAMFIGRASERFDGVLQLVLQEPGFRKGAAEQQLIVAPKAGALENARDDRGGGRPLAALEGSERLRDERPLLRAPERDCHERRQYTSYTAAGGYQGLARNGAPAHGIWGLGPGARGSQTVGEHLVDKLRAQERGRDRARKGRKLDQVAGHDGVTPEDRA